MAITVVDPQAMKGSVSITDPQVASYTLVLSDSQGNSFTITSTATTPVVSLLCHSRS